jgi:hypothetical protein
MILLGMREDGFDRRSTFELFMFPSVGRSFDQYGGIAIVPVPFVAFIRKEPIDCFVQESFGSFVRFIERL